MTASDEKLLHGARRPYAGLAYSALLVVAGEWLRHKARLADAEIAADPFRQPTWGDALAFVLGPLLTSGGVIGLLAMTGIALVAWVRPKYWRSDEPAAAHKNVIPLHK